MSPSIEKTPSVTTRISRYGSPAGPPVSARPRARASASFARKSPMSLWPNTTRGALLIRMPSMIEAWLSASETIRSFSPVTTGMTPVFAVKPDWNVRTASVCLNAARSDSSFSWKVMSPAMVRTAPEPAPNSWTAAIAAALSFGCVVRPR